MKIVTGLEVVKENLLKNEMGIGYVQDAIDYIEHLEEKIESLEIVIEELEDYNDWKTTSNVISRSTP